MRQVLKADIDDLRKWVQDGDKWTDMELIEALQDLWERDSWSFHDAYVLLLERRLAKYES